MFGSSSNVHDVHELRRHPPTPWLGSSDREGLNGQQSGPAFPQIKPVSGGTRWQTKGRIARDKAQTESKTVPLTGADAQTPARARAGARARWGGREREAGEAPPVVMQSPQTGPSGTWLSVWVPRGAGFDQIKTPKSRVNDAPNEPDDDPKKRGLIADRRRMQESRDRGPSRWRTVDLSSRPRSPELGVLQDALRPFAQRSLRAIFTAARWPLSDAGPGVAPLHNACTTTHQKRPQKAPK